jgi:hypothetical protein
MSDRELLELAAKAAGLEIEFTDHTGRDVHVQVQVLSPHGGWVDWNPIEDDGDALRLAVKLNLRLECMIQQTAASTFDRKISEPVDHTVEKERVRWPFEQCPYAATRLAIVRAAAEIGRAMP